MSTNDAPGTDLKAIQFEYEAGNRPVRELAPKHGISERALYKMIRDGGWIRRQPGRQSDTASMAERLKTIVRRGLAEVEENIVANAPEAVSILQSVQTIAKTLDRIFEMEKKEHAVKRTRRPKPRLVDDERCAALARRFEGLSRQIELERNSQTPHPG